MFYGVVKKNKSRGDGSCQATTESSNATKKYKPAGQLVLMNDISFFNEVFTIFKLYIISLGHLQNLGSRQKQVAIFQSGEIEAQHPESHSGSSQRWKYKSEVEVNIIHFLYTGLCHQSWLFCSGNAHSWVCISDSQPF